MMKFVGHAIFFAVAAIQTLLANVPLGFSMVALVARPAFCADEANAGSAKESASRAMELRPKVWVTDPRGAARDVEGEEWYDPRNYRNANAATCMMPPERDEQIFKTAAAWKMSSYGRDDYRTFAFRIPVDDNAYLMETGEFPERVNEILKRNLTLFVNEMGSKPKFTLLEGIGKMTADSISLHIRIDNSEHILGFENATQLISKRYMIVDGRFFYLGVKGHTIRESKEDAIDRKVRKRARQNERYLDMWECDIRLATLVHRLLAHGGNAKAAAKAIDAEIAADKARLDADIEKRRAEFLGKHGLPAGRESIFAKQGSDSTGKPGGEAANGEIAKIVMAGIDPDAVFQTHAVPVSLPGKAPLRKKRIGLDGMAENMKPVHICIIVSLLLIFIIVLSILPRRTNVSTDFEDFQRNVERCLLTDSELRRIVTRRMLDEWALIIRFFATGKEPRRLCVPAVLFLWEKIFEPKMSYVEVIDLDKRIRSACGWDKMFSRENFESIAADVIKKSGYGQAWNSWRHLGDYAYSISERIAGNAVPKVPPGFGSNVYRLFKTWYGRFGDIAMSPIDWKHFFRAHPGFAEFSTLILYDVLPAETIKVMPFLHAEDGDVSLGMMRKNQKKVELDAVGCNLYLPEGWNAEPESSGRDIAVMAGPRDLEWLSVERRHLSPGQTDGDLGAWVDKPRFFSTRLPLHPPRSKADGVNSHVEVAFEKFRRRDVLFMRCHHADDMVAFSGTINIAERLCRVFIVVLRREAESWKFEYVFPASEGVTKEALELHSDEIQAASRIFVPIEMPKPVRCSLCGKKMDNPAGVAEGESVHVLMKCRRLFFDERDLPDTIVNLPWCETCRRDISDYGISREILEAIPDVDAQLWFISEVKCGAVSVQLHYPKHNYRGRRKMAGTHYEPAAVKIDWKTLDMPEKRETFSIIRTMSPIQMNILRKGHVPKAMDDKWFWYMNGDTLFAYRSMTGYCIYRIDFSPTGEHGVTVNRDTMQYKCTSIERDKERLNGLLDLWSR